MVAFEFIAIEVAYASGNTTFLRKLKVPVGTTLRGAIERARLLDEHPEIDLVRYKVGVFGKLMTLETLVVAGDRVEVYCPLLRDPKERRRRRAAARAG
ncbi:MAG: RnfH family protein [Gammaproteobacteria bacterium]|nr:RnfH family protein [Gammaproteobacteria bacterium]